MLRRRAAVAVVAVALLALLGTATPALAATTTNGTATTTDDATNGTVTTAGENATRTTIADDAVELVTDGDDRVVLRPAAEQTVRGRTSLPQGTELSVRIRASDDRAFLKSKTATVGENGTFAATFDFDGFAADAPVEAHVGVRSADGDLIREYDAVIRSASAAESPASTTATTSAAVPGFGPAAAGAAVGLLAAVALARTRRTD